MRASTPPVDHALQRRDARAPGSAQHQAAGAVGPTGRIRFAGGRAVERFASNASTASPPPSSLTGRNTGLDLPTAVSGFTGQSTVAITNASGVIQQTVAIDFSAGTMSVNGGGATPFTPANFLTQLNAGLGGLGTATFTNGALSIAATGSNGVAINEGTSQKAGQGFSQFFGLNDVVCTSLMFRGSPSYDTGLCRWATPTASHRARRLRRARTSLRRTAIRCVRVRTVAVPPAGTPGPWATWSTP